MPAKKQKHNLHAIKIRVAISKNLYSSQMALCYFFKRAFVTNIIQYRCIFTGRDKLYRLKFATSIYYVNNLIRSLVFLHTTHPMQLARILRQIFQWFQPRLSLYILLLFPSHRLFSDKFLS